MFVAGSAVAIGAATFEKALQEGSVDGVGREGESTQEVGFALAQGEGGEAFERYITHNMSNIARYGVKASENENVR